MTFGYFLAGGRLKGFGAESILAGKLRIFHLKDHCTEAYYGAL
jgi:hypothetical protein